MNLGIADLLFLVAASALGLALTRFVILSLDEDSTASEASRIMLTGTRYLFAVLPTALMWTIALLILRFRSPRPSLRRLIRQPGMIACVAVAVSIVLRSTGLLILGLRTSFDHSNLEIPVNWDEWLGTYFFVSLASEVGVVVLCAWVVLILSGDWRLGRGWIERASVFLGIFWIGILPFYNWNVYWFVAP